MSARKHRKTPVKRNNDIYSIEHKQSIATYHEGPLPSPDVLYKYDQIYPGSAEKIISMWENQVKHRQSLEKSVIDADLKNGSIGMWLGFVIAITGIISGAICILNGHEVSGTIFGGASLTGLVSVFIYGSRQRRKEREAKVKFVEQG